MMVYCTKFSRTLYGYKMLYLLIGIIRSVPLTPHVIDSCEPHMSLTCDGIYLNLGSFNGIDPKQYFDNHLHS
jgi:hypothetical protein